MSDRHETLRTDAQFDAAVERSRKHGIWGWLEAEARRARTREAELERKLEFKALQNAEMEEELDAAEAKCAELERALAQTQWMLRWTERDDALMNALVAKTEAEAKSAALEREVERLRGKAEPKDHADSDVRREERERIAGYIEHMRHWTSNLDPVATAAAIRALENSR